jgi:hypothetical protein
MDFGVAGFKHLGNLAACVSIDGDLLCEIA